MPISHNARRDALTTAYEANVTYSTCEVSRPTHTDRSVSFEVDEVMLGTYHVVVTVRADGSVVESVDGDVATIHNNVDVYVEQMKKLYAA